MRACSVLQHCETCIQPSPRGWKFNKREEQQKQRFNFRRETRKELLDLDKLHSLEVGKDFLQVSSSRAHRPRDSPPAVLLCRCLIPGWMLFRGQRTPLLLRWLQSGQTRLNPSPGNFYPVTQNSTWSKSTLKITARRPCYLLWVIRRTYFHIRLTPPWIIR